MSRNFLLLSSALVLVLTTGCSGPGVKFSGDSPQVVASPDKVSLMLAESSDRASTALETLAAVEKARTPATQMSPVQNVPAELRRAITINWVGPIDPIVKTLADRAGYGFLELGKKPTIPVVVSIDAENQRVIDVLRDIGLQLGMRGDVKVDAEARMIEIYYSAKPGIGG